MHHPVIAGTIPIRGVAGDQQSALFGQCCFNPGQVKATFGTGCFLLMNTGAKACAYSWAGHHGRRFGSWRAGTQYALEGGMFMAGNPYPVAARRAGDNRRCVETEELAKSVPDSLVCVVPAFTGLKRSAAGTANARGAIYGLTRGATSPSGACLLGGAGLPGARCAAGHGA